MTKEQRAESRAICDAALVRDSTLINVPMTKSAILFAKHAITVLPAALDALDEAEEALGLTTDMLNGVITDRDHWKAHAEALLGALLQLSMKYDACAETCGNRVEGCRGDDDSCNGWQFNQARFAPSGKGG